MDAQQQLFGLMAVAEEHQKAVKDAIDGLASERAALAKERAALAQAAAKVAGVADDVKQAAAEAVPALRTAVGEAVDASVERSLAGASDTAAKALGEACKPIVDSLSGMARAAGEAEGKLSGAVASFGWKWATVAGGAAAGGIAAVLLAGWISVWWERHQVEQLAEQRAALHERSRPAAGPGRGLGQAGRPGEAGEVRRQRAPVRARRQDRWVWQGSRLLHPERVLTAAARQ